MSQSSPLPPRALVTGAGLRLGRDIALYLAGRGFDVAVHYRSSRDAAEAVASEIRAMGRQTVTLRADLMVEAETQALLPAASQALGGPVTCLVNNASTFEHDDFTTATRASWDTHLESNLRAPFVLTQAMAAQALPRNRDTRDEAVASALVVNMIDQRVLKPTPHFMSYTVSKMALWGLTQTAAQALAPWIRVNAIGPGPTLQGAHQSDEVFARQRQSTILERGVDPADITAALGYFLDAPAVTGQLVCPDGGQHLAWDTPDISGLE